MSLGQVPLLCSWKPKITVLITVLKKEEPQEEVLEATRRGAPCGESEAVDVGEAAPSDTPAQPQAPTPGVPATADHSVRPAETLSS